MISHGVYDGSGFVERNEWHGTRDIAAFLTAPAAIDYQREHNWRAVRAECHRLALQAQTRICEWYQQTPFSENHFAQMVTVPLPECDVDWLRRRLYNDFRIEAPVGKFADQCNIRISVQAYSRAAEIDLLIDALDEILGQSSKQAIAST